MGIDEEKTVLPEKKVLLRKEHALWAAHAPNLFRVGGSESKGNPPSTVVTQFHRL